MKAYPNIETRKNRDGSRTAYDAGGRSWRVTGVNGNWSAIADITKQGSIGSLYFYDNLQEISAKLSRIS